MKVFITGDSHTAMLQLGKDLLSARGELPSNVDVDVCPLSGGFRLTGPFFVDRGDFIEPIDFNKDKKVAKPADSDYSPQSFPELMKYRETIERLPFSEESRNYSFYGLSAPLFPTRIWRNRDWERYSPLVKQQKGRIPVSTSLLRRAILDEQKYIMQFIEIFKRLNVKIFAVEAPRPFRHHWVLTGMHPRHGKIQTNSESTSADKGRNDGIIDAEVVTYIDGFYREVMKEWLASKEVPVIEIPDNCYDAEGFMHDRFRHPDPKDHHHGNDELGAIMVQRIIEFVTGHGSI